MEPNALNVEIIQQVQAIPGEMVKLTLTSERNTQYVVLAIYPSEEFQKIIFKGCQIHGHGM